MLSFLYVYSDHSILECYNLFSGVELSMRSFFVISFADDITLLSIYRTFLSTLSICVMNIALNGAMNSII